MDYIYKFHITQYILLRIPVRVWIKCVILVTIQFGIFFLYIYYIKHTFRVYRTVILDVVCGFGTWSLSLRLEQREGVQSQDAKEDNYSLRERK